MSNDTHQPLCKPIRLGVHAILRRGCPRVLDCGLFLVDYSVNALGSNAQPPTSADTGVNPRVLIRIVIVHDEVDLEALRDEVKAMTIPKGRARRLAAPGESQGGSLGAD